MCCAACSKADPRISVETSGSASAAKMVGRVQPGPPFAVALDVYVNGNATVELRTPRGAVVFTTTTTGPGAVQHTIDGAVLPAYELFITPASGSVEYRAGLFASR